MIRVLQVTEKTIDHQTRMGLAQLSATRQIEFQSRTVHAEPILAIRDAAALRRQHPDVELVHAWGLSALKIAAFASKKPILLNPTEWPDRTTIRWVRAIQQYRTIHVIAPTETSRRRWVERGIPMDRCHMIPPGVDFGRIDKSTRPSLRDRLGYRPDDRVVLAVGESTRATDHHRAVWAAVILHVLDPRNRILLWGRGAMADSVRHFAEKLQQPKLLTVATDRLGENIEFDQLLGAADVALVTNASPAPTLPIAMCMAAAMPIVSTVDSTICELLEDRHNALLCTSRNARPIARRLLDLQTDEAGQWARSDQARAEAFERFSRTRYVEAVKSLYQAIVGVG